MAELAYLMDRSISVCMAAYNGDRFIGDQIDSILKELGPRDELIIVDDASTDTTAEVVLRRITPAITFYRNDANLGVVRSFEKAIGLSSGDVIFLCDQDDLWYPGKVAAMASLIEGRRLVVVCDCNVIDECGAVLAPSFQEMRRSRSGFFNNLYRNGYLGCAMCFKSSLKSVILPFPAQVLMHDEWIGLVGDVVGEVFFLKKALFGYRRHSSNVTKLTWGGFHFAVKKRFLHAFAILKRLPLMIKSRRALMDD